MKSLQGKLGERYKKLIVLITKWCKNHSIYGEKFGFLNDKALNSLAYYLVVKDKDLPLFKILEKFHKIFEKGFELKFEEKVEISKKKVETKENLNFEFVYDHKNQDKWVILNSEFHKDNALEKLNKSTKEIIQHQMKIGSEKLNFVSKEILEGTSDEVIKQKWSDWLGDEENFVEQYNNFLLILCSHSNDSLRGPLFCEYFENDMEEKFPIEIKKLEDVEYIHIKPKKLLNNEKCPEKFKVLNEKLKESLYNIWVIGIKEDKLKETFKNKVQIFLKNYEINLKISFEDKIKEFTNNKVDDFRIRSKYLKKDELENFIRGIKQVKGDD